MNALGDRGAERRRCGEVLQHVDEPHDRADDPHRRREAAGLLERRRARMVARAHAVDLGLQHLADEVGVDAVDDELEALAGELVVDLVDLLVEREQALRDAPARRATRAASPGR